MNMSTSFELMVTIDNALKQTYGRFQAFTTGVFAVGFWMGGFLTFTLALMELYPQFECYNDSTGTYSAWTRDKACAVGTKWHINWEHEHSINNWIVDLDLYCVDKWKIGLFGSMYYLGFLLGSVAFINVSDIYGRKLWARVSFIGHWATFLCIMWINSLNGRYFFIFLCGFIGSMRCSVSYTSGCEWLPKSKQIYSSMITQMINACVPLLLAVYFWKISKHWIYFYDFTLILAIIGTILWFFIPESPRWLVSEDRNDDAKKIINDIAR